MNLMDRKNALVNRNGLFDLILSVISDIRGHEDDFVYFSIAELKFLNRFCEFFNWLGSDLNEEKKRIVESSFIQSAKDEGYEFSHECFWVKSPTEFEKWYKSKNNGIFEEEKSVPTIVPKDKFEFLIYYLCGTFFGTKYERKDVVNLHRWLNMTFGCLYSWHFSEGNVFCENPKEIRYDEELGCTMITFQDDTTSIEFE